MEIFTPHRFLFYSKLSAYNLKTTPKKAFEGTNYYITSIIISLLFGIIKNTFLYNKN